MKKFQIPCSCITCKLQLTTINLKQHYNSQHLNPVIIKCAHCEAVLTKKQKFCNQSCSAKYNNLQRGPRDQSTRIKIRESLSGSKYPKKYINISWCKVCNTLIKGYHRSTCKSIECLETIYMQAGLKSAAKQVRRSKDERKLFILCQQNFQNIRHNEPIIDNWDADIILDDYKVAVLWNGPWHYKDMPHKGFSLKQVQNRDSIKIRKLTELGWKVIVFEDRSYTPEQAYNSLLELVASVGIEPT